MSIKDDVQTFGKGYILSYKCLSSEIQGKHSFCSCHTLFTVLHGHLMQCDATCIQFFGKETFFLLLLPQTKEKLMEIVNIEAGTFGRMSAALEKLVSKLQNENKLEQGDGLEEWLDNQDVCQQLKISPSKLLTLRRSGAIAYSRIDRKIYYKREDIRKFMERELKKLKNV